jgi:hypothetical protein
LEKFATVSSTEMCTPWSESGKIEKKAQVMSQTQGFSLVITEVVELMGWWCRKDGGENDLKAF